GHKLRLAPASTRTELACAAVAAKRGVHVLPPLPRRGPRSSSRDFARPRCQSRRERDGAIHGPYFQLFPDAADGTGLLRRLPEPLRAPAEARRSRVLSQCNKSGATDPVIYQSVRRLTGDQQECHGRWQRAERRWEELYRGHWRKYGRQIDVP